jgi:hypothetical protein
VTGVIYSRSTKPPIAGAVVELMAAERAQIPSGVSDAMGVFHISTPGLGVGAAPGEYGVRCFKTTTRLMGTPATPPSPTDAVAYGRAMESLQGGDSKAPPSIRQAPSIEPGKVVVRAGVINELVLYLQE